MVTNGQVGSQLNWSAKEKVCHGIYYGVKIFEDLDISSWRWTIRILHIRYYDGKLYLQDTDFDLFHVPGREEQQFVPDVLSRLCTNHVPPPPKDFDLFHVPGKEEYPDYIPPTLADRHIVTLRPVMVLPPDIHAWLSKVCNSKVGHWDWISARDDFVRLISDKGRKISLIAWYQSSFDSARHESHATPDQSSSIYMCFI